MFPRPTSPRTRFRSPTPVWVYRVSHCPLRVIRSFHISLWPSARMNAANDEAMGRRTPSGVIVSATPFSVQAPTSTVSYPTPNLATRTGRSAPENVSAETLLPKTSSAS